MQVTRFTDFALRVLMQLALREGEICKTGEMASTFAISKHHLTKVIQELQRQGWVITHSGVNGGVQIQSHTLDLNLKDLVLAIESFDLAECFDSGNNACPITSICRLRGIWGEARDAFLQVLAQYTVRDLIARREEMNFFLG